MEPRDAHAAQEISRWREIEPPTYPYQECCYFHELAEEDVYKRQFIYSPLEKQTIDSVGYCDRNKFGPWIYQKGKIMFYIDLLLSLIHI